MGKAWERCGLKTRNDQRMVCSLPNPRTGKSLKTKTEMEERKPTHPGPCPEEKEATCVTFTNANR